MSKCSICEMTFDGDTKFVEVNGERICRDCISDMTSLDLLDKQIIIEDLKLRVNLDGDKNRKIYEVKTYRHEKGFKVPRKYINQVNVQMFATGFRSADIVAYGLIDYDYRNYFNAIDGERLSFHPVEYDERWINNIYLPRLEYYAECLRKGVMPRCLK